MRYFIGLVLALALGVIGCSETSGAGGSAGDGGAGGEGGTGGSKPPEIVGAERAALEALTEYIEAFNEICDDGGEAWAKTLNYPHVRFCVFNGVAAYETEQEYIESGETACPTIPTPTWDHSEFDSIEIVQSGPRKVHITLVATQCDAAGNAVGSFETLFIMTENDGHRGTQARSSYAPL